MNKKEKTTIKSKSSVEKEKGKTLTGIVVSDKTDKTVTVSVTRFKEHPKYKKRYKISKRYKAHDENNQFKVGDKITIRECAPISKDKRWRVVK